MKPLYYLVGLLLILSSTSYAYRYALVIGHNDGGKGVEKLKYAEKDATQFARLLTSLGGFAADKTEILLHPKAADIDAAFKRIAQTIAVTPKNGEALFLIYYSGHANEKSLLLKGKEYSLQRLKSNLASTSAGITVGVFDACHSGVVTRFKGGRRAEPFYLKDQRGIKGQVIIASSAATELAQESDMLKGSIFSHHWINGLRGSADLSGDKKVTLNEAYNYAYNKTVETSALSGGQIQHPSYKFNIHGQGTIALTNLSKQSTGVLFNRGLYGKFLVLSSDYTDVYADFFKKNKEQETFISLNPGNYTAINVLDQETRVHSFAVPENNVYLAQKELFRPNVSTINRIKGENPMLDKQIEPKKVPLSRYSLGMGLGVMGALNNSWQEDRPSFSFSLFQSIYLDKNLDLFFHTHWIGPGKNVGALCGLDFMGNRTNWSPFAGAGFGMHWLSKEGYTVSEELKPSLALHAGFEKTISPRVNLRLQIPWTITFNDTRDNIIGLEALFVIGGRFKHVKALRYD